MSSHHDNPSTVIHSIPRSGSLSSTSSDEKDDKFVDKFSDLVQPASDIPPLADRPALDEKSGLGTALLRALRLKKRAAVDDLDSIATQPSVYDGPLASHYAPRSDWEVCSCSFSVFRLCAGSNLNVWMT